MRLLRSFALRWLVLALFVVVTRGEIRPFHDVLLEANSKYIHYIEGYLVTPGFVDLAKLQFTTRDNPEEFNPYDDDDAFDDNVQEDDDYSLEDDDRDFSGHSDEGGDGDGDGDGGRVLVEDTHEPNIWSSSQVDIVLLPLPDRCANSRSGCDWTKLGIGAENEDGELRWCCTNDALELGFCEEANQYGKLLVNQSLFKGQRRSISVPATGQLDTSIRYGKLEESDKDKTGQYVLIFANCNDEGRNVYVDGIYSWKSAHGFLPGDLFGEMYFFAFLTCVYFVLLVIYGAAMVKYEDSKIPIQKWIAGTILMGVLETFFRTGDYFVWNEDGTRFWLAMYTGIILGVLKRGVSRVLVVMVSLGWGVVRDTLGNKLRQVVALGVVYVGVSATRDVMDRLAKTEIQTLSTSTDKELFDIARVLTFVVAGINVVFFMWILDSLSGTMEYLDNMSQSRKLQLYLRLRCILLFSLLFAVVWAVLAIVDNLDDGILDMENEWAISAVMELNYLFVLIAVAILWRPNPNAKYLAHMQELPALGDDDNELEMTDVVPSAFDDDEEYHDAKGDTKNGGYRS